MRRRAWLFLASIAVVGVVSQRARAGDDSLSLDDDAKATADAGAPAHPKAGNPVLPSSRLRCFNSLPQADLADLLSQARLVVTNGGSTLLQAIACGRACVAVPIAQDQSERIQRCVNAGVAASAALAAPSIVRAATNLLRDESARAALAQRASKMKLANGIEIALNALAHLAEMA